MLTRFSNEELALIDELVATGTEANRTAVGRRGVRQLAEAERRARTGAAIADSSRSIPQLDEAIHLAMANAIALADC